MNSTPPVQPRVSARKSGVPAWAWIGVVVALFAGSACGGGSDDESGGTTITDPVVGTRDAPIPIGEIADIGAGWRLQVLDVTPDLDASDPIFDPAFFEPAPTGFTYLLVRMAVGYFGTEDPQFGSQTDIDAFGASSVALDDVCPVMVPGGRTIFNDLFSGGVVVDNACFVAPVAEAGTFQLYGQGDRLADDGVGGVYFELGSPSAAVLPMASLSGPQPGAKSTAGRLDPAPLGTPIAMGDHWQLTVTGAARDITDEVLAADDSNMPPRSGFHFVGVELTFLYDGDFGASPGNFIPFGFVDSDNVMNDESCGAVPGKIDLSTELLAGDSTSGTMCLVVRDDASNVLLFASTSDFEVPLTWFATS